MHDARSEYSKVHKIPAKWTDYSSHSKDKLLDIAEGNWIGEVGWSLNPSRDFQNYYFFEIENAEAELTISFLLICINSMKILFWKYYKRIISQISKINFFKAFKIIN